MARPRVSMKGKGADLFFGEYTPPSGAQDSPTPPVVDPNSTLDDMALTVPSSPPIQDPATTAEAAASHASATGETRRSRSSRANSRIDAVDPLASKQAITQESNLASNQASMLASTHDSVIETIRRSVRVPGKEVSYLRLTDSEKRQVAKIVFSYKDRGLRTSENEINRIALNALLLDYEEKGDDSLLARVLAALQA